MTNTLMIPASALLALLEQYPDVKIELVKNATLQVAEALRKRIDRSELSKEIVEDIRAQLAGNFSRYNLPKTLLAVIDDAAKHAVDEKINSKVTEEARKLLDETVKRQLEAWRRQIDIEVRVKVTEAAEKQVSAMLAAAAKIGRGAR